MKPMFAMSAVRNLGLATLSGVEAARRIYAAPIVGKNIDSRIMNGR